MPNSLPILAILSLNVQKVVTCARLVVKWLRISMTYRRAALLPQSIEHQVQGQPFISLKGIRKTLNLTGLREGEKGLGGLYKS